MSTDISKGRINSINGKVIFVLGKTREGSNAVLTQALQMLGNFRSHLFTEKTNVRDCHREGG